MKKHKNLWEIMKCQEFDFKKSSVSFSRPRSSDFSKKNGLPYHFSIKSPI